MSSENWTQFKSAYSVHWLVCRYRHYVSVNVSLKGSLFVCGKSWALEKDKMLNFIPLLRHSFLAGCHLYTCFCFLSEQFWKDTLSGLHLAINVCHSPVPYRKGVRQVRASCVRDEGVKAKVADRLALLICQCLVGVPVARCVWGELKTSTVFFPLWERHTWIIPSIKSHLLNRLILHLKFIYAHIMCRYRFNRDCAHTVHIIHYCKALWLQKIYLGTASQL